MDENNKLPDALRDYIDAVIEQKVKEAVQSAFAELSATATPVAVPVAVAAPTTAAPTQPVASADIIVEVRPAPVAPMIHTPALDDLWIDMKFMPNENGAPLPNHAERTYENAAPHKSRFSLKKKVSFLVIGVLALAICVQVLSGTGLVDFGGYSELTSTLFGNVFGG